MITMIEVPKDFADIFSHTGEVFTDGAKYYVHLTAREEYPNQLLIQTAPNVEADENILISH